MTAGSTQRVATRMHCENQIASDCRHVDAQFGCGGVDREAVKPAQQIRFAAHRRKAIQRLRKFGQLSTPIFIRVISWGRVGRAIKNHMSMLRDGRKPVQSAVRKSDQ